MYHSVTFGNKNTWDDWHLVPKTRPVVNPPEPKIKQIDIPGGDGVLDLTNALSGYTYFKNRTGSMEFIVVNELYQPVDTHEEWYAIYSNIMNYLHGKKMRMILDDDKGWFYEGRFKVNSWKSDAHYSSITIDYDVGPYKWDITSSTEDWLWDPFNFYTGMIPSNNYRNISLPGHSSGQNPTYVTINIDQDSLGYGTVTPRFYCNFQIPSGEGITPYLNFQIPGYEEPKLFDASLSHQPLIIPELTFRRDMPASERKIVVASDYYPGTLRIEMRRGSL